MLEGTDLYSAYQPFNYEYSTIQEIQKEVKDMTPETKPKQSPTPTQQPIMYDANIFNQRYEQEQRILQMQQQQLQQQQQMQQVKTKAEANQQSYVDKMFSKKRELVRLLQFVFVIVLALSIHWIIKYYLKDYIEGNEVTRWREFILRMLYPVSIFFILWNLKIFIR